MELGRPLPSIMEEVVVLDAPRKTTQDQSDGDSDDTCTYDSDVEVEDVQIPNLSGQLADDLAESDRSRARAGDTFVSKAWRLHVEKHGGALIPLARKWKRAMDMVEQESGHDSDAEVEDVFIPDLEEQIEEDEVETRPIPCRRRQPRMDDVGRVGHNVYEVMQVQPRKKIMQRDVLVKNDTGAQMTFINTDLFEWCLEEGIITNVRGFEREAMVGIGGQTLINQMGDMKVCLEGSMVPVVLQVVPSESICDRNFQILLGTDNTKKLGAQIDLKEGVTRYTNLPGIDRVLSSMHLSPGTAKRVFNSRRV